MSKFSFPVALAATAIAIPLAQKATATVPQNSLDYVNLATPIDLGNKTTWRSPAFQRMRLSRLPRQLQHPSLAESPGGSGKKQEVLSLPAEESVEQSDSQTKGGSEKIYRVQSGDTLSAIAERESISLKDLIQVNNLEDPNLLEVGQQIIIPKSKAISTSDKERIARKNLVPNTHPISPIATEKISVVAMATLGTGITHDYPTVSQKITNRWLQKSSSEQAILPLRRSAIASNKSGTATPIQNQQKSTVPNSRSLSPHSSLIGTASFNRRDENLSRKRIGETVAPELPPLSSPDNYLPNIPRTFTGYRWGRMHKGIDIAAPIGTPVVAAASGKVVWAGWNKGGYGNLVKVKHADGSVTLYAHNSRVLVYRGQMVRQGEQIAQIGSTGFSTGPHPSFVKLRNKIKS